jgi:hypothetical protein
VCGIEASVFTFLALAVMGALFARRTPPASATPAS